MQGNDVQADVLEREENDRMMAPPTMQELRELSERLEQRCRLEDIFQNKTRNRTVIAPLKLSTLSFSTKKISDKKLVKNGTMKKKGDMMMDGCGKVVEEKIETARTSRKKKSSLRSRIQNAQDSQYLT